MNDRDVPSQHLFFAVAVNSFGRAVPGADHSVGGVKNNAFVNRVLNRFEPGNSGFGTASLSQVGDRDDGAYNLFGNHQGCSREFNRNRSSIPLLQRSWAEHIFLILKWCIREDL